MNDYKLAICQMKVVDDKDTNISKAVDMIGESAHHNADLVILPEMFNCPYDTLKFSQYAEERGNSKTLRGICNAAQENKVHIIAGSIPESVSDKTFNTSFVINAEGELVGWHRKLHLFDINIPNKIYFKESDTITNGNTIKILNTDLCRLGIAICYDIRFPELIRQMILLDADLIAVPAAFNMTTGPLHWECTLRTRAVDNQVYIAAASPARNKDASYKAYGHSMIVNPWGEIVAETASEEDIIYANIKAELIGDVRIELPLLKNRRTDLY